MPLDILRLVSHVKQEIVAVTGHADLRAVHSLDASGCVATCQLVYTLFDLLLTVAAWSGFGKELDETFGSDAEVLF